MKKILIAQFKHETNSFSPHVTGEVEYRQRTYAFGAEIPPCFAGVKDEGGAFFDEFGADDAYELIPAAAFNAMPAGPVVMSIYETMEQSVLAAIRKHQPDGILLSLHGAMVLTEDEDGEGRLLEAIRKAAGPDVPVLASLDLHANITKRMTECADGLFAFREYPHTDMYETGLRAARCMRKALEGQARPVLRVCKLDLILSYLPTALPQMAPFVAQARELSQLPGILDCSICHGFFPADLYEMGAAVLTVSDGDAALAQDVSDRLGQGIWDARHILVRDCYTPEAAIEEALSATEGPIVLADVTDNPGAGAPCDGTHLLRALLEQKVQGAALAIFYDPEAVALAVKAGVGATIDVALGGKTMPELTGEPLLCKAYVKVLTDGVFRNRDKMSQGLTIHLGNTAVLVVGGVQIITVSNRAQPYDLEVYRHCGIVPEDQKILVVKSTVHFRDSFETVSKRILDVEVPGLAPQSPKALSYKRCRRPIYPLDKI